MNNENAHPYSVIWKRVFVFRDNKTVIGCDDDIYQIYSLTK